MLLVTFMRWLVSSITLYSGQGGPSSKTHLLRPVSLSLVCTNDASVSTRNLRVNRCDASISALCLCLRRPGLHVRHNDASISRNTREWNDFHSFVLVLVSLHRTCKPGRRKERKLKKSVSVAICKMAAGATTDLSMLMRLRMSPYAYAYRTCKHPCACAKVVHVSKALFIAGKISCGR